jgi:hypothetical protein
MVAFKVTQLNSTNQLTYDKLYGQNLVFYCDENDTGAIFEESNS